MCVILMHFVSDLSGTLNIACIEWTCYDIVVLNLSLYSMEVFCQWRVNKRTSVAGMWDIFWSFTSTCTGNMQLVDLLLNRWLTLVVDNATKPYPNWLELASLVLQLFLDCQVSKYSWFIVFAVLSISPLKLKFVCMVECACFMIFFLT